MESGDESRRWNAVPRLPHRRHRSINIPGSSGCPRDTVKGDRDGYWIARWKLLVKLVSNLSDLWKRRVPGFILVRLIINLCQQMCRRHWFKSPARWLTLPNLVCPSGPAWCPIGLPERDNVYLRIHRSGSNMFRVPSGLGKEMKKKIPSLARFDRRRQFPFLLEETWL